MSAADPSINREESVRLFLAGHITPEDYACRVVPAPQRLLRTSRIAHALSITRVLAITMTASVAIAIGIAVAAARQPSQLLLLVLLGTLALLTLLESLTSLLHQRLWQKQELREIDHQYRERYHAAFRRQLKNDLAELPEGELPDPDFVQAVVRDLQRTLTHVGVPNAHVCILLSDGDRDLVSYYAGDEQPRLRQGAIYYDFTRVASREVVCSIECSLGLAEQTHRIAVVATCIELAPPDEKLVIDTAKMLSDACDRQRDRELIS